MKPVLPLSLLPTAVGPLALLLLAGCGEEPAAQPAATQAPVAAPATPSLPAPDEEIFAAAFAAACPEAEPVAVSSCRSLGLGESDFSCEYGLGEDEVLRHDATLTPAEGEWTLVDPETVCAQ